MGRVVCGYGCAMPLRGRVEALRGCVQWLCGPTGDGCCVLRGERQQGGRVAPSQVMQGSGQLETVADAVDAITDALDTVTKVANVVHS